MNRLLCAVAATTVLAALPGQAAAGAVSAPMTVSVTVVRSCSLDTAAVQSSGTLVLTCSSGASPGVLLGNAAVGSAVAAGPNRMQVTTETSPAKDGAQVLTINF